MPLGLCKGVVLPATCLPALTNTRPKYTTPESQTSFSPLFAVTTSAATPAIDLEPPGGTPPPGALLVPAR
jgi:hypothetical protein